MVVVGVAVVCAAEPGAPVKLRFNVTLAPLLNDVV